jgi:aryl-alcohol dehydrogenase-like predicted oxidoreductase
MNLFDTACLRSRAQDRTRGRIAARWSLAPPMHSLVSKLGLGAGQFGLDAAAAPRARAPEAEAREILALAGRAGVRLLDAGGASAHGEAVIGAVTPRPCPFAVTLKAPRGLRGPDQAEYEVRAALARLALPRADAVMVQAAGDLLSPSGQALWDRLRALKDQGLFARLGIAAYASDDPVGLVRRFRPDVLQVPASLLDQRLLADGSLAAARDLGVEVHLRSIFLHGLLFRPLAQAPRAAGAAAARLSRARRMIAEGRSDPLQAALGFALSRPEASAVIVSVATAAELAAVIAAAASPPPDLDWDDMALNDPDALRSAAAWARAGGARDLDRASPGGHLGRE